MGSIIIRTFVISFSAYVQEIARAGRDGEKSTATLYFNASDIASNKENLKEEMKQFCLTDQCGRAFICKHFGFEWTDVSESLRDCCDNCEKQCNCIVVFRYCLMTSQMPSGIKAQHHLQAVHASLRDIFRQRKWREH